MKTIQVVVDERLLRETDRAARREKMNRSQIVRAALGEYLARRRARRLDEEHRRGYERFPVEPGEFDVWDEVLEWPAD